MTLIGSTGAEKALRAVGEILEAEGQSVAFFKLYAAVDHAGPTSVQYQDLLALKPTEDELDDASQWVATMDASPEFPKILSQVVQHVRQDTR